MIWLYVVLYLAVGFGVNVAFLTLFYYMNWYLSKDMWGHYYHKPGEEYHCPNVRVDQAIVIALLSPLWPATVLFIVFVACTLLRAYLDKHGILRASLFNPCSVFRRNK